MKPPTQNNRFQNQEKHPTLVKKFKPIKTTPLNKKALKNTLNKKNNLLIVVTILGKNETFAKNVITPKNKPFNKKTHKKPTKQQTKTYLRLSNVRFYKI
jgi:hypothetical protein